MIKKIVKVRRGTVGREPNFIGIASAHRNEGAALIVVENNASTFLLLFIQ